MDPLSLTSSVATLALLAGLGCRYGVQWAESSNKAREEMLTLIDEAQNTRHALEPIEEYAKTGYASESEKRLVLACIERLHSLEARLLRQIQEQLGYEKLSFYSRVTWWFKRNSFREIAANIAAQKTTLIALQVSILANQVVTLNRKIDMYEAQANGAAEGINESQSGDGTPDHSSDAVEQINHLRPERQQQGENLEIVEADDQ